MSDSIPIIVPQTRDQFVEQVRELATQNARYSVEGMGTRREHAAPDGDIQARLSLRAMDRIERMDAEDMTCRVQCGLRLSDLEANLREQDLALEAGPFLASDTRSLGGIFSEAPASPRGFDRGSLRSQLLGLSGLDARGRKFQAGGRVVKNVAGYDLMKLFVGGGGAWFTGLELELRLIRRPPMTRLMASHPMPLADALALWRSLRPAWIEARSLDLHIQGDGSAIVELALSGKPRRVSAWTCPASLPEDRSDPAFWDRMSPHASTSIPTHRGQILPSQSPAWIQSLPEGCQGTLHLQGSFSLVVDTASQARGTGLDPDGFSGTRMKTEARKLARRLKQGLSPLLSPGRLSYDTSCGGEGVS